MRILLLAPRTRGVGGIAQHVRALARRLRELGAEARLVSADTLRTPAAKGLANPLYALASPAKTLLREYDIVHGHSLPSLPAVLATRGARILTLHGHYSRQIRLLYGSLPGALAELAEKTLLRKLDAVTVVSRSAAKEYRVVGIQAIHIPNAIDLRELPQEVERIQEPQITYLGRLSREKGVDLLLEAVERHGLKGLVIAGDGPLKPLVQRAHSRGHLRYLGALPRPRALRILAGSDAAVIPSREEGVSTFILEAMALGVPVTATRVGGTIEVLRDGVEGVLVEPEAGGIAEAVRRLLESPEDAEAMARRARSRVKEEFSWDVVAPRYLELYQRLLVERDDLNRV